MDQAQVAACIHRFPQLFSLNVEANLAPKWRYLVDYIHTPVHAVATVCSYPGYFSLSLTNRWGARRGGGSVGGEGAQRAAPLPLCQHRACWRGSSMPPKQLLTPGSSPPRPSLLPTPACLPRRAGWCPATATFCRRMRRGTPTAAARHWKCPSL